MNEVVQKLVGLGFRTSEAVSEKKSTVTVKIRTSNGWTYEKFDSANLAAIDTWATKHSPE